jgi:methionyl-tRNA synthetase
MSARIPRYLTTTLPYVNAEPHIGHAQEFVYADALARFWRKEGSDVFFNTGTDEHGQKIADKAREAGQEPKAYVDHFAATFVDLKNNLNLSYDAFIRTTDQKHIHAAQELWRRCEANGDIYKKKYSGLYCVGDEMFLKDTDLVDGRCPNHPNMEPVVIEEENYFFALSKYQDRLLDYLNKEGVIVPNWRRLEACAFVEGGLEDFSISREAKRMSWGISVPGDETQVMYVWFDALTNYISTLGWPEGADFATFWEGGDTTQVAGKDQVRFQSIMWQAMLMSAEVKPTDRVVYHGFITSGGQKMSKSLGNVISPKDLVARYGTDATRYLLLRHVHPFEDTDITFERMDEWYNAHLANGIGNLASRIMKLAETHLREPVSLTQYHILSEDSEAYHQYMLSTVADSVWQQIGALDHRIQHDEPFKVVKTDPDRGRELIRELVVELAHIAERLSPIMPDTSATILRAVSSNTKPVNLFARLDVREAHRAV